MSEYQEAQVPNQSSEPTPSLFSEELQERQNQAISTVENFKATPNYTTLGDIRAALLSPWENNKTPFPSDTTPQERMAYQQRIFGIAAGILTDTTDDIVKFYQDQLGIISGTPTTELQETADKFDSTKIAIIVNGDAMLQALAKNNGRPFIAPGTYQQETGITKMFEKIHQSQKKVQDTLDSKGVRAKQF